MADVTVRKLGEMDAIFFGSFKRAGDELEIGSFGMNIIDMPPGAGEQYPDHTHEHDSQEEVYMAIKGSGKIVLNDGEEEVPLDEDTIVRVGPSVKRKIFSGDDGMRLLALGGVVGQPYTRPDVFKKGEPDPTQQPAG
jgi:mannose-6-phosphate isomerase-like protein (cupin superfamily)